MPETEKALYWDFSIEKFADLSTPEREIKEMTDKEIIARSPCLGDCLPNDEGICQSCFLSLKENDQWNHVSNQERLVFLENTRQRQKAKSEGGSMTAIGTNNRD